MSEGLEAGPEPQEEVRTRHEGASCPAQRRSQRVFAALVEAVAEVIGGSGCPEQSRELGLVYLGVGTGVGRG